MNNLNEIDILVDNFLRTACTREEYDKMIEILRNPEYNSVLQTVLTKKWNEQEDTAFELSEQDKKDIRQSLSNIHHEINLSEVDWEFKSKERSLVRTLVNIAATLFIPVLCFSIWYIVSSRSPYQGTDSYITINTPTGSKLKTELPDGTIVWQNSGSTIKYPQNFTKRNRQVILNGEAYFEVSSDKLHPFYVKTRDLLVEVTGTKFDVKGYEDEESSSVVLEKGVVSVKSLISQSSQPYKLIPGDKFETSHANGQKLDHDSDVNKYTSWKDGKLIFRDDPLDEVLKRLGRWYNVEIVLNDPRGKFNKLPFTLTIQIESLPQILDYIRHAVPITIKEEKMLLSKDGSLNKQKYTIEYRKN